MDKIKSRAYGEAASRDHGMIKSGVRLPVGPHNKIKIYQEVEFDCLRQILLKVVVKFSLPGL